MDLFASIPVVKRYRGRPPGNSPELYYLDSCLNKDFHKAVDCHVRYTHSLHKLDSKRFSIETPKKVTSAYLRIFYPIDDIAPSIERIISDMYDVLTSIKYIVEDEGCIIPDVNNANKTWKMRRRGAWGIKDNNHGGKMVLILAEDDNGVI